MFISFRFHLAMYHIWRTCWCEIYQNQVIISILLLLLSLHLAYLASLRLRLVASYIIDCCKTIHWPLIYVNTVSQCTIY